MGFPAFVKASGRFTTGLYAVNKLPPCVRKDARREVVTALAEGTDLTFSERAFDGEPSIPLTALGDPRQEEAISAAWQALMDRIRAGR